MPANEKKSSMISTVEKSQLTKFLGVDFSVLLPRERSECVELLLERFPPGLSFPVHQHKECEQTYFVLEGEAEITLEGKQQKIVKGGVVYIPRFTDHAVKNAGSNDLVYLVFESYPDGYLPNEPTWDSHIKASQIQYASRTE